jgi:hypothetical protein
MALSLVAVIAPGCAVGPAHLAGLSDLDICRAYGAYWHGFVPSSSADDYKQEMLRRKLLTPEEWTLATERRIRQGMSQCALYASWGEPVREYRSDRDGNVTMRHVYRMGWNIRPGSVFTRNGKVEGWAYQLK